MLILCSAEGLLVNHAVIIAFVYNFTTMLKVSWKLYSGLCDCTEPLQVCQVAVKVSPESEDWEMLGSLKWFHQWQSLNFP